MRFLRQTLLSVCLIFPCAIAMAQPTAVDDVVSGDEDTNLIIDVLGNDLEGAFPFDPATIDLIPSTSEIDLSITVSEGTFTTGAGEVVFVPTTEFSGNVTPISYSVQDTDTPPVTTSSAAINVTVDPVDDPPIASDDNTTTPEETVVTHNVTSNDTDIDGTINAATVDLDPGTGGIQNTFSNAGGGWSVASSGVVTFTPALDFTGPASVSYRVNDNGGATSNTATLTVSVTNVNDAPTAVNDNTTTPEETVVTHNVTSNDTDIDGTINAATVDLDPGTGGIQNTFSNAGGGWSVASSGVVTFTPALDFTGPASVSYRVNDNGGATSNTATLTVSVTNVNDAPTAVNDNTTTPEETVVTHNVTSNDTDIDGTINAATVDLDPGTGGIQNTFSNAGGSWSVASSGVVTFTPVLDFAGPASVSYRVNDNGGATSNTATLTVSVTNVNDAPTAVNDNTTTPEETVVTHNVTSNDTDIDGTINAASVDLDPGTGGIQNTFSNAGGGWSVASSGVVTFTPALDFTGPASVSYRVNDNGGATSNTATLTVSVTNVNDAPTAVNDNTTTPEETVVTHNVTSNDTDIDGTINAATVDLDPGTGGIQNTFSNAGGSWSVASSGVVTFTPALDFAGPASVSYRVNDNGGATSNTATLTVSVTNVNDAPTAVNDNTTTPEETVVTHNVTSNDTDIDGTINAATVDLDPGTGGIQNTFSNAGGSWSVASSGVVTFTPALDFTGPASVSYRVNDNGGATSNTATLTVSVTNVNDAPTAVNDNTTTPEETVVTHNVTSNDTDIDGTINAATVDLDPGTGGIQNTFSNAGGSWSVASSGVVTFTPALDFAGPASVSYRVNDNGGATSNTATLTVSVTNVNDAPTAVNDNTTTPEETVVTHNVTSNDTDIDGTINAATVDLDPGTGGIQNTFSNAGGGWSVASSGVVTFTPALDFTGPASVSYRVNDNGGATSNTATLTVSVTNVNDAPTAVNDNTTTPEETVVTHNVTSNDTDIDGTINAATVDLDPGTGGIQNTFSNAGGSWSVASSGVVTFTPALDFTGPASVSYRVNDNGGATSNTATLTVSVTNVNDAPTAVNDNTTTPEETVVTHNVTSNDTDIDGTINAATVDLDPGTGGIQNTFSNAGGGWSVASSGVVTFTPALDFTGPASVSYRVNDNGGATSNTATLTVSVTNVNDAPTAVNDNTTTPEETVVTHNVTSNDTDIDGTINAATVDLDPGTGGIQNTFSNAGGSWSVASSGVVTFTPALDFTGPASVSYRVNDNGGATSNTATLTVSVTNVNDAPTAVNDNTTTPEETVVTHNVTSNDTDIDGTINAATVDLDPGTGGIQNTFSNAGGSWSVASSGVVTFTPALDFAGPASVSYRVNDNGGATSNTATLTVSVTNVNDAPTAVNDNTTTPEETVVTHNVTSNDTDIDGTINAATVDLDPGTGGIQNTFSNAGGSWSVASSGVVTFTPALDFTGPASVSYRVNDNGGATSNTATLTVSVTNVNDAPTAVNDNTTTPEETVVTHNVTSNDTDIDGTINAATVDLDPGTGGIQNTFSNAGGSWSVASSGVVTFTPVLDFTGPASITYSINDNNGATSNTATFSVTVNNVNDPPTITPIGNQATNEDTPTPALTFTIGDVDNPIGSLSVTGTSNATTVIPNANIVISGTGANRTVTLTPAPEQNGLAVITLTVYDGTTYVPMSFAVTVTPVSDPPTITTIPNQLINEDSNTGPLAFTLADIDNPVGSLTLTGGSDNLTLVPISNIAFGGSGANRTVTVTPAADQTGIAIITVTVNDGTTSVPTTFQVTVDGFNDPPTISAISNQSTTEDVPTAAIPFTVGDPETPAADLTVTASSDNVGIIPNANIIIVGTGTNRTVQVTPEANQSGAAVITLTVSDGVNSTPTTFQVTVNTVNDPPTITAIPNQTVNEDAPTAALPFTINDVETAIPSLTLTTSSNNVALVPLANITLAGSGANHTVQVTPLANQFGTAVITVTVNDGGNTTSTTFQVTVTAVNDLPTITAIGDQTVNEDTPTSPLSFTLTDIETPLTALTVTGSSDNTTLVPVANIVFAGTGGTRTVTVTPAANQTGVANVTLTLNDGTSDVPITFQVTVNPVNDAPVITGQMVVSTNEEQPLDIEFSHLVVTDVDNAFPTGFTLTVLSNPGYLFVDNTITPNTNVTGNIAVRVQVYDGALNSNIYNLQVTVNPINDPPVITGQSTLTILEDNPLTFLISHLTIADPDNTSGFTFSLGTGGNYSVSGGIITPDAHFNGTLSVPVTVSDGGATSAPYNVQIQVTAVNDKPQITGQTPISIAEVQPVAIDLSQLTVFDPDNAYPADFELNVLSGPNYNIEENVVTPVPNFSGTLLVRLKVFDGLIESDYYDFQILVNSTNDAPVITGQRPLNTEEHEPIEIQFVDLTVVDPDNAYPTGFSLKILPGTTYTFFETTVTPNANVSGLIEVSVKVNDGSVDSAPYPLKIDVNSVNDAPVITGQLPMTTLEDTPTNMSMGFLIISDPDSPIAGFTMEISPGTNYTVDNVTDIITPAANFHGTLSVPVTVNDGSLNSQPYNLQIQVTAVNDAPSITGQNPLSTLEDQPIVLKLEDFLVTDIDNTYPAGFTLQVAQGSFANYDVVGTTVTPKTNFTGTLGVTMTISDGVATSNSISAAIVVNSINDAPTLDPVGNVLVTEDPEEPSVISLTGITAGVGEGTQSVALTISTDKPELFEVLEVTYTGGTIASVRIDPKADKTGTAQVTIRIQDDGAASPSPNINFLEYSFEFTIDPENDAPTFTSQPTKLAETAQAFEYDIVVADVEGEVITITAPTLPSWLILTQASNGQATLSGIPPLGTTGGAQVVVVASDPAGSLSTQEFSIVVNARPTITPFAISTDEDHPYPFTAEFASNYSDADGNAIAKVQIKLLPTKGRLFLGDNPVSINAEIPAIEINKLNYRPMTDSNGTDIIKWNASDGVYYSILDANIVVSIIPFNDPPEITALEAPEIDTLKYELGSEVPVKLTRIFDARDPEGDNIIAAEIGFQVSTEYREDQDVFSFRDTLGIHGAFLKELGVLTLTGKAPVQDYVAAIRTVRYNYLDAVPDDDGLNRKVSIRLNDGAFGGTKERLVGLVYTNPGLDIANAFTPNGDVENQYWKIYSPAGLERYKDALIRVYDKRGALVYEATGFSTPWNGEGPNGALPPDSYYYTIDLKYDKKKYKGVVTILR